MSKNSKLQRILLIAGILIFLIIVISIAFLGKQKKSDKQIVGFIMSGAKDELGWNGMHYNGIMEAGDKLGITVLVKENVKEFSGQCEVAIRELVEAGAGMIVLSSYGYSEEVKNVVREYPEVVFYANSPDFYEDNMTTYFTRMYQVRYLSGILAGMQTQTNQIGYVAAMSNNEVNRGINAFMLGVRRVNPDAEVIVKWTDSWDNEQKEKEAVELLIEEYGIDVVTYHQNQAYVIEAAEQAGIYSIGYHQVLENCSEKYLTTVACDWSKTYEELVREYLQGRGNSQYNFWIGLERDAVCLTSYSAAVTQEQMQEIEKAQNEILAGQRIFSGDIFDLRGRHLCSENENISDEVLLRQMNWFAEGIKFYGE